MKIKNIIQQFGKDLTIIIKLIKVYKPIDEH